MSCCSWKPTKMFERIGPSGDPIDIPSICLYIWLLKLNSTPQHANINNSLKTSGFRYFGANLYLNSSFTTKLMHSLIGKLVKRDLISKEHILMFSWLIFNCLISLEKLNEYLVQWIEYTDSIDFKIFTHHLAILCCGELIIERTGLRGTFALCVFGNPYSLGLHEPDGRKAS